MGKAESKHNGICLQDDVALPSPGAAIWSRVCRGRAEVSWVTTIMARRMTVSSSLRPEAVGCGPGAGSAHGGSDSEAALGHKQLRLGAFPPGTWFRALLPGTLLGALLSRTLLRAVPPGTRLGALLSKLWPPLQSGLAMSSLLSDVYLVL